MITHCFPTGSAPTVKMMQNGHAVEASAEKAFPTPKASMHRMKGQRGSSEITVDRSTPLHRRRDASATGPNVDASPLHIVTNVLHTDTK